MQRKIFFLLAPLLFLGVTCGSPKGGGIFRSTDGGTTWEQKTFIEQIKRRVYTIAEMSTTVFVQDKTQPGVFYLGTKENGIFKTTDAGEIWQRTALQSGGVSSLTLDPLDASKLYAVIGENIWKSVDSGMNWEIIYTHTNRASLVKVAADFFNAGKIFAIASDGTIISSSDFGNNWKIIFQGTAPFLNIVLDYYDSRVVYALDRNGKLWVTQDGGTTWVDTLSEAFFTKWQDPPIRITVDPIRSGSLYMVTRTRVLKSTDFGNNWERVSTLIAEKSPVNESIKNFTVDPRNECILYFTVGRVIHKSTDCGLEWNTIETFASSEPISMLLVDHDDSNVLYSGVEVQKKQRNFLRVQAR